MPSLLAQLGALTDLVGKNLGTETRLFALNQLLEPLEHDLQAGFGAPRWPVTLILGPPRSGTTLLSQILAEGGAFGWVNNLAARFWLAPALGMRIAQALEVGTAGLVSNHHSRHGQTDGWSEPHEFGYFWSRWFDLGSETHHLDAVTLDRVDVTALRRALAAMEAVAERPMLFKNNTWFTFQADWCARALSPALLLACERDVFFLAQSLWNARLARYGTADQWWSVRPSGYRELLVLQPVEQVARQAVSIVREMEAALARVPPDRLLRIPYDRLCRDPRGLVREIACRFEDMAGHPLPIDMARLPEQFDSTDRVRIEPDLARALRDAVDRALAETPA